MLLENALSDDMPLVLFVKLLKEIVELLACRKMPAAVLSPLTAFRIVRLEMLTLFAETLNMPTPETVTLTIGLFNGPRFKVGGYVPLGLMLNVVLNRFVRLSM